MYLLFFFGFLGHFLALTTGVMEDSLLFEENKILGRPDQYLVWQLVTHLIYCTYQQACGKKNQTETKSEEQVKHRYSRHRHSRKVCWSDSNYSQHTDQSRIKIYCHRYCEHSVQRDETTWLQLLQCNKTKNMTRRLKKQYKWVESLIYKGAKPHWHS